MKRLIIFGLAVWMSFSVAAAGGWLWTCKVPKPEEMASNNVEEWQYVTTIGPDLKTKAYSALNKSGTVCIRVRDAADGKPLAARVWAQTVLGTAMNEYKNSDLCCSFRYASTIGVGFSERPAKVYVREQANLAILVDPLSPIPGAAHSPGNPVLPSNPVLPPDPFNPIRILPRLHPKWPWKH